MFEWVTDRKLHTDAQGKVAGAGRQPAAHSKRLKTLRDRQKKAPWRKHQNLAYHTRGRCCYEYCPNRRKSKAKEKRGYDTYMRCEECSAATGKDVYLCNNPKSSKPVLCHIAYHSRYHNRQYEDNEE